MRKQLLTIICIIAATTLWSQYCGTSGTFTCTSSTPLDSAGFMPNDSIPCIVRGANTSIDIKFTNYNQFILSSQTVTLQSLRIDSIGLLPDGLCWSCNKANNTFLNQETGCIRITGRTFAQPGQYKISVLVWANIGIPIVGNDGGSGNIILRVIEPTTANCPPVDTSIATAFTPFPPLTGTVATVTGKVYYDANPNNVLDPSDVPISNVLMDAGGYYTLSNAQGNYSAYLPVGNYVLQPNSTPGFTGSTITPQNIALSVQTLDTTYDQNNFSISVPVGVCNTQIHLSHLNSTPPRPGFNDSIWVICRNILGQPISPTIYFKYPAEQSFLGANPTPASVDTNQHLVIWNMPATPMGQQFLAHVDLHTPVSVPLLTPFNYLLTTTDTACTRFDTLNHSLLVRGAYDPNDKAVSPVGVGSSHAILPTTNELTYTVRFQNTGNFYAEKVEVIDTISPHLQLSTLKVMAASHNYDVVIENNRAVKFIFNNIFLPDSNTNEPASHGFFQYTIQPLGNLPNGTVISNRADIYFDFNQPILTNTVFNTVDELLSIAEVKTAERLYIYPNPTTSECTISIPKTLIGSRLIITDLTGREVMAVQLQTTTTTLSTGQLSAGVYIVKAGNGTSKLVVGK